MLDLEFIFEPLELQLGKIQNDGRSYYLFDEYEDGYLRLNKIEEGTHIPELIFKNIERNFDEFTEMCEFHQSDPSSHFMKKKLISLPTANGRITISGKTLKITENNKIIEKELKNETEFEKELLDKFKITIKSA